MTKYILIVCLLFLPSACQLTTVGDQQPDPVELAARVLPLGVANASVVCSPIGIFEGAEVVCQVPSPVAGTTYTWTSATDPEQVQATGPTFRFRPSNDFWRLFDVTLTETAACDETVCPSSSESVTLVLVPAE